MAWRFLLPALAAIAGSLLDRRPVARLDARARPDRDARRAARRARRARRARAALDRGAPSSIAPARRSATRLGARVTVIAPDGTVLGESSQPVGDASRTTPIAPRSQAALRDRRRATPCAGARRSTAGSSTSPGARTRDGDARVIRIAVPISSRHRAPAAPARPGRDRARHGGDASASASRGCSRGAMRRRIASPRPLRRRARAGHAAAADRPRARATTSACSSASSPTWRATSDARSARCASSASGSRRSCAAWSRACSSPTSTAASSC